MSIHSRPVLTALTTAMLLTACGGGTSSEPRSSTGDEVTSIRLLTVPATDSTSVQFGAAEGIFEKHGLDVEVTPGQGGAAIAAALQAGEADLGIVDFVSLFAGAANGLPLSVVAPVTLGGPESPGVFVMGDGAISSASDLRGKNIGVISRGSIAELSTLAALKEAGVPADAVTFVAVPAPNLVSALTSGQVDASFIAQPGSFGAVDQGATLLFPAFAGETDDLPVAGLVAADSWIAENPDAVEKVRDALAEAVDAYNADPQAALDLLPTFTTVKEPDIDRISMPTFTAEIPVGDLQRVPDLMLKFGFLKEPVEASSVLAP